MDARAACESDALQLRESEDRVRAVFRGSDFGVGTREFFGLLSLLRSPYWE
jgi:hypothetical protein